MNAPAKLDKQKEVINPKEEKLVAAMRNHLHEAKKYGVNVDFSESDSKFVDELLKIIAQRIISGEGIINNDTLKFDIINNDIIEERRTTARKISTLIPDLVQIGLREMFKINQEAANAQIRDLNRQLIEKSPILTHLFGKEAKEKFYEEAILRTIENLLVLGIEDPLGKIELSVIGIGKSDTIKSDYFLKTMLENANENVSAESITKACEPITVLLK